jgi:hypothetical protein
MCKRLIFVWFVLVILRTPDQAHAQFTDPHTYDNTPAGTNQIELAYAYARANASIDTSLIVTGARFNLNQGTITYTRYFGFLHHLAWVEAGVPLAGLNGSISGTNIQGSTTGAGDSSYLLGALLKGGPALSAAEFANHKPVTTVGMSLTITAPTGQYDPTNILNLGSDRWSFKPEIAVAHPFGPEQKWKVEAYANSWFFTDNTSYHGREILRQHALPGLEGHFSYSFIDSLWASLDARYSFRGVTYVNDVNQSNAQQNFSLGSEVNVSLNPRSSLVFVFDKALVHRNGPALSGFTVKYNYSWRQRLR